jgi:TM2 domain-containing membrane protein YozV
MPSICPHCGKESVEESPRFCSGCGARMDGRAPTGYPPYAIPAGVPGTTGYPGPVPPPEKQKKPLVAAACSAVFPGLGQVYNGSIVNGVKIFFLFVVGLVCLVIPGIVVWVYGIYDAYRVAGKMNTGEVPFQETRPLVMALFVIILVVMVVVTAWVLYTMVVEPLMTTMNSLNIGTSNLNQIMGTNGII